MDDHDDDNDGEAVYIDCNDVIELIPHGMKRSQLSSFMFDISELHGHGHGDGHGHDDGLLSAS